MRWKRWSVVAALVLTLPMAGRAEPDPRRERLYLNQLAFVLAGVRGVLVWVERHPGDAELSRFVYPLSQQYASLASKLIPTARLSSAHPHVIIVAENAERAVDAAAHGEIAGFQQRLRTVREELRTLEAVLKQLRVRLPEVPR